MTSTIAADRVVRLAGELDLARRDEIQTLLAGLDDGEPLVVDLADADFVDLQTVALLARRRGSTELRGASAVVERVWRLLTQM